MKRYVKAIAALLLLIQLCGCALAGPKEKTSILREPTPQPSQSPLAGTVSLEIKRIYKFPFEKTDPAGLHPDPKGAVLGWLDNDSLLALAYLPLEEGEGAQGEGALAYSCEVASVSYQYGFYNPLLRLEGQRVADASLSHDRQALACRVLGGEEGARERMAVYSLAQRKEILTGDSFTLDAAPVWSAEDGFLGFVAQEGEQAALRVMDVRKGDMRASPGAWQKGDLALDLSTGGKQALVASAAGGKESALVLATVADGQTQPLLEGELRAARFMGERALLFQMGDRLYYSAVSASGPAEPPSQIQESVLRFAVSDDKQYVALAKMTMDGSIDISIGRWSGQRVINEKLIYKDFGDNVYAMHFSPDNRKLYLEGEKAGAAQPHVGIILEFN